MSKLEAFRDKCKQLLVQGLAYVFIIGLFWGLAALVLSAGGSVRDFFRSKPAAAANSEAPAAATPPVTKCDAAHRFEKTEVYPLGLRADIALDSCSGKLCKTWAWVAKGEGSAWSTYNALPLCSDLPDVTP